MSPEKIGEEVHRRIEESGHDRVQKAQRRRAVQHPHQGIKQKDEYIHKQHCCVRSDVPVFRSAGCKASVIQHGTHHGAKNIHAQVEDIRDLCSIKRLVKADD